MKVIVVIGIGAELTYGTPEKAMMRVAPAPTAIGKPMNLFGSVTTVTRVRAVGAEETIAELLLTARHETCRTASLCCGIGSD